MTYRRDPFIPQQAEEVRDVVIQRRGAWTGREMVAGGDGVWHRIRNPSQRTARYPTNCGLVLTAQEARTALSGDPSCDACRAIERTSA